MCLWHTTLILACGRQMHSDFCEFEATHVYGVISRVGSKAIQRHSVSKNQKLQKKKPMKMKDQGVKWSNIKRKQLGHLKLNITLRITS